MKDPRCVIVLILIAFSSVWAAVQGDLNTDGTVDYYDIFVLQDQWLTAPAGNADLNTDNQVNFADYVLLAQNWLRTEPLQTVTIEDVRLAACEYNLIIEADYSAGRFIAPSAGQRLPEKLRKICVSRMYEVMQACDAGNPEVAFTAWRGAYLAMHDHFGLLVNYYKDGKMSLEHILDYCGGHVTAADLEGDVPTVKARLINMAESYGHQDHIQPNAFSILAELGRRYQSGFVCDQ